METNKERLRLLNTEKSLGKMPSTVVDKEASTMSTMDHTNDKSRSYVEAVQKKKRLREVVDLTVVDDPKRLKMGEEDSTVHKPNPPIAKANSSSSSLGHLCNNDKRDLPPLMDNEQMLAHATKVNSIYVFSLSFVNFLLVPSCIFFYHDIMILYSIVDHVFLILQTLMWVVSKAKESLQPREVILKLQNDLKNERQLKVNAEKKVETLKLKLAIETHEKDALQQALILANSTIEDLEGKVVMARERKENAREEWYWKG